MRRLISSGSPFEAAGGYSRAVVDGEWVFVAGTTGFDYAAMTISDDPAEQTRQAPDLRSAAADYTTHCAVCHGTAGRGDGPAAKGLTPPPADLTDADRMGQHSVFGL